MEASISVCLGFEVYSDRKRSMRDTDRGVELRTQEDMILNQKV